MFGTYALRVLLPSLWPAVLLVFPPHCCEPLPCAPYLTPQPACPALPALSPFPKLSPMGPSPLLS